MLPHIPIHHLLFADTGLDYLVYSQGNTSEEPILARMDDAVSKLSGVVDKFLHHNLPISNRTDNSVGFVCDGEFFLTRRGRGFVPERMELSVSGPCVIGVGAEMRASFAVTTGKWAWTSPFIGNMDNRDAHE